MRTNSSLCKAQYKVITYTYGSGYFVGPFWLKALKRLYILGYQIFGFERS